MQIPLVYEQECLEKFERKCMEYFSVSTRAWLSKVLICRSGYIGYMFYDRFSATLDKLFQFYTLASEAEFSPQY